jgi:uncharacterized membrane protein SpoIIM required for sporulation
VGASIITGGGRGEKGGFVHAVADWIKIFVLVVLPLLLVAAFVEANITPRIVTLLFGG